MTSRFPLALLCAFLGAGLLAVGALSAVAEDPPAAPVAPEPPPAPEKAKDFTLKDLDGKERTLAEFAGKWVVLEWTNYGCPFVKKHYKPVEPAAEGGEKQPGNIPALQKTYTAKGVAWLSICSSGPGKEGHMSPEAWKAALTERMAAPTAVLLDEDGKVGKAYGSKNTPGIWIIDPKGFVAYVGAVDDLPSPRANPADAENKYVVQVLDAVLAGKEPPLRESKHYG